MVRIEREHPGCGRKETKCRHSALTIVNWEINNRAKWNEDVTRRSLHAAAILLPDAEVESSRRWLQQLTRNSLAWRAFTYFMGCFA